MSKVSVLVAAYNVKEYISEAMASVVAQTLKDIEIVVVDDCSTDGTFEIISKYAELDSRIKVIRHDVNSGILRTRRDGFLNSTGDYIMFLDGDDTLTPDACENAYKAISEENLDMLEFDFDVSFIAPSENTEEIERNLRKDLCSVKHKAVSISKAGMLDSKETGSFISFQLWNKIYNRAILEKAVPHIPDEYINMADDVFFSFLIHFYVHTYNCINDRLYEYKFGCGMSTTDILKKPLLESIAKMAYVYHYLSDFAKKQDAQKECEEALHTVFNKTYFSIAGNFFHRVPKEQKEEFISEVMNFGTADDLILAISEILYSYALPQERIATDCAKLSVFSCQKKSAKTIGVYYFRVRNGGVENVISSVTDIWVKAGYDVVLFTDEEPHKDDYYINPSVKRVVIPAMKERDFENRKNRITAFRKALIENNVDVMVYNAWVSPDLVLDELIIKSCGVNLIVHTHNMFCCEADNPDGYYAHLYSVLHKLYSLADSVITLTEVDNAWWEAMGIRSFKTINPVQFDMSTPSSPLRGNNILFVGRISEEKQVIDAIKVVELVKKEIPEVTLTIVGKGDDQNYINHVNYYIEANKLHDMVNMAGFTLEMLPYYLEADLLLCTSRYEGFGLALMESKICGLPMVCYEMANLDITRENRGMAILDQSDINGAAKAIIRILKNDTLKKEMGREARKSAEEFLSIDLAEHWRNIFKNSLSPKPNSVSIRELPVLEASMRLAINKYSEGIVKRAYLAQVQFNERCAELESRLAGADARCLELDALYVQACKEIENIRRSETYRLGRFITFIPRKIIGLLKRILGRS